MLFSTLRQFQPAYNLTRLQIKADSKMALNNSKPFEPINSKLINPSTQKLTNTSAQKLINPLTPKLINLLAQKLINSLTPKLINPLTQKLINSLTQKLNFFVFILHYSSYFHAILAKIWAKK